MNSSVNKMHNIKYCKALSLNDLVLSMSLFLNVLALVTQEVATGVFFKKGVIKNFSKFTGKYLCQSPFYYEFAGLRPVTLLKKKLRHSYFPVNFTKF